MDLTPPIMSAHTVEDPHHEDIFLHVSDEVRHELLTKFIEPFYSRLVQDSLRSRFRWRKVAIAFDTISKILIVVSGITSFLSNSTEVSQTTGAQLSVVSGSFSCLSLGTLQLGAFAAKESVRGGRDLNMILRSLKIQTVPMLSRADDSDLGNTVKDQKPKHAPDPPPPTTLPTRPRRNSCIDELHYEEMPFSKDISITDRSPAECSKPKKTGPFDKLLSRSYQEQQFGKHKNTLSNSDNAPLTLHEKGQFVTEDDDQDTQIVIC